VKRPWLFVASPLRASSEAVALYLTLGLIIGLFPQFNRLLVDIGTGLMLTACMILAAVRLHWERGPWQQHLRREGLALLLVSLGTWLVTLGLLWLTNSRFAAPPTGESATSILSGQGGEFLLVLQTYLWLRVPALLWRTLYDLQRRRLSWSLTYASLLVMAGAGLLLGLGLIGFLVWGSSAVVQTGVAEVAAPLDAMTLTALFVVLLLLVLFLIIVAVVITFVPTAIFAHFFTKRTTGRLEQLAQAASAMQAGDLTTRLTVDGDDEVARLQRAFNAMAGELQQAMVDLAQANAALQGERDTVTRLLRERRTLIASVSHELRTPVATVRGYLDSALAHWNGAPLATLHGDLQVMEREMVRLGRLIDDLFTLARAEVGALTVTRSPVDVAALLARSAAALAPGAWERGRVEVLTELPPDLPLALADEGRLEQVIGNLLHNAIRHTPPGGVVVLSAEAVPGAVMVQVRDTGEGIASGDLPHIFERFYRASSVRDGSGAGLGLALVKELTEAMGGSVAVESMPGQGALFRVRLPLAG
jgi:signal transduction histidine kinase